MKTIVIWGAGNIARGFAADLFGEAGYSVVFVDTDESLIRKLKEKESYNVVYGEKEAGKQTTVAQYTALHASEKDAIMALLQDCDGIAVSVPAQAFENVADVLAETVRQRMAQKVKKPLDVFLFADMLHPPAILKEAVSSKLSAEATAYLDKKIGFVDTCVNGIAATPTKTVLAKDPLAVATDGPGEILLERGACKGKWTASAGILFTDMVFKESIKKFYTLDILYPLYAYRGFSKGYTSISDCRRDAEIQKDVAGALEEAGEALIAAYGFAAAEIEEWNTQLLGRGIAATVETMGKDPLRELMQQNGLTGAALLCKKNGIWPYYLTKGIAYAFLFDEKTDANAQIVKEYADFYGVKAAAAKYCGLEKEPELLQMIAAHYEQAQNRGNPDERKITLMKTAYRLGFMNEKQFKGCAQGTLRAFFEMTGEWEPLLFQSASGFSGGMAVSGDGVCGGYSGGLLYMGSIVGRRLEEMLVDGDKVAQYKAYEMAQKLRDRFLQTYGSVICSEVHKQIFGKSYCLRTKAVKNEFEAAGAHRDKCTHVIGTVCAYIAEILYEDGYLK